MSKRIDMNVLAPDAGLVTRFPSNQAGAQGRAMVKASNVRMSAGRIYNAPGYEFIFGLPLDATTFNLIQSMTLNDQIFFVGATKNKIYSMGPLVVFVNAGPSLTVYSDSYTMAGKVNGPTGDILIITWTTLFGPGEVTYTDITDPNSPIIVTQPGVYGFQLSASDGVRTTTDTCVLTFVATGPLIGNEEQIYTAYCTPPLVGTPSVGNCPAGTFTAFTLAAANALALASAQAQAEAGLVCTISDKLFDISYIPIASTDYSPYGVSDIGSAGTSVPSAFSLSSQLSYSGTLGYTADITSRVSGSNPNARTDFANGGEITVTNTGLVDIVVAVSAPYSVECFGTPDSRHDTHSIVVVLQKTGITFSNIFTERADITPITNDPGPKTGTYSMPFTVAAGDTLVLRFFTQSQSNYILQMPGANILYAETSFTVGLTVG
jgi:hypothetical protein